MEEIWKGRVEEEKRKREEKEKWADEVVRQLEKERKVSFLSPMSALRDANGPC